MGERPGEPLLKVTNLTVSYGPIKAVKGVSLEVYRGEVVSLIGANGAGKSSLLRAISGLVPYGGEVAFEGGSLAGVPAHKRVGRGITHVPEGRGIFGNLSVMENLTLATWQRKDKTGIAGDLDRVFTRFPRLRERSGQPGNTLSGGEQQMLAIGRALMANNECMLLDEPSMGLSPLLVEDIFQVIREINAGGVTIVLVEQNANMAILASNRGYVMESGVIALSGSRDELSSDPRVIDAYLGV
ncbi:MAG: ABC transporter ATP-binding protein [Nitrospirae bacterium]|nr:ABC transporter ATP-binding protein [Nitrospirota bacterium]